MKKKQDKKPKKKAGKKGKTSASTVAADDESEAGTADTSERADSPVTVSADTETPPPEHEEDEHTAGAVEVADTAADDVGMIAKYEESTAHEETETAEEKKSTTETETKDIKEDDDLNAHISALKLENAALRDSLATANTKIQLDASTIASLQASSSQTAADSSTFPAQSAEYYRVLEEKFSREAQERYLLERDYVALKRTHEKLMGAHVAALEELETLKTRFSAEEKRRQIPDSAPLSPDAASPSTPKAKETRTAPDINARLQAGRSSFFRTAQGLSAAVVKGVTGGANVVISEGPGYVQRQLSSPGMRRQGSTSSYTDVELYGDDAVPEDGQEDDEAAYERGLEKAKKVAEERAQAAEEARARQEWIKNEVDKWRGYQIDLQKAGGSGAGHGEIFVV